MTLKIGALTKLGLFFPVVCFIHVFDQTLAQQLYRDKALWSCARSREICFPASLKTPGILSTVNSTNPVSYTKTPNNDRCRVKLTAYKPIYFKKYHQCHRYIIPLSETLIKVWLVEQCKGKGFAMNRKCPLHSRIWIHFFFAVWVYLHHILCSDIWFIIYFGTSNP